MKSFKMKTLKALFSFSLVALLFPACSQSTGAKEASLAAAPSTDIHTAVLYGDLETVKQHITADTDLNQKEPMGGSTPLISAITFDKQEIAKALIEAGADLNLQNNDGSSALHVAAFFCRVESTQLLLDAGANKTLKNKWAATPLETITGPFEEMKPVYEMMKLQLGPLGLDLDLQQIEKTRPVIAIMLQ